MSIGAIQARLLALHPKRIDLSLARIERLLAALGHPEQHLPPVIHVAGTNGKGSTIAFARAILEAAGKRVHVYTSPNLVRLNERFRIGYADGGKLVEDDELAAVLSECEAKNGDTTHHGVRDGDGGGVSSLRAASRRYCSPRSRAWRPSRRDQRRARPDRQRDHAGVARSSRFSRRHDRGGSPPRKPASLVAAFRL